MGLWWAISENQTPKQEKPRKWYWRIIKQKSKDMEEAEEPDEETRLYQGNPLFAIFMVAGYISILASVFIRLENPVNAGVFFWLGICAFVPAYILRIVHAYSSWRGYAAGHREAAGGELRGE